MKSTFERSLVLRSGAGFTTLAALVVVLGTLSVVSAQGFIVPEDTALRIRLDDTLTSTDSQVGDPFSATVVDAGPYRNARVYGHIVEIDMSGKLKGRTSMILRFDRLIMPDGRRTPIHAEIVELYHAPSGEKVDVEGAIESGGRGRKAVVNTAIGAGAGAWLGGIFGSGKGAGIGSIVAVLAGCGLLRFMNTRRSRLAVARKMMIRISGR